MLNFGLLGGAIIAPPPLVIGDYIWYGLDRDTGFITDGAGKRFIFDGGSSPTPYNGSMYSGQGLTFDGVDQGVEVELPLEVCKAMVTHHDNSGLVTIVLQDVTNG